MQPPGQCNSPPGHTLPTPASHQLKIEGVLSPIFCTETIANWQLKVLFWGKHGEVPSPLQTCKPLLMKRNAVLLGWVTLHWCNQSAVKRTSLIIDHMAPQELMYLFVRAHLQGVDFALQHFPSSLPKSLLEPHEVGRPFTNEGGEHPSMLQPPPSCTVDPMTRYSGNKLPLWTRLSTSLAASHVKRFGR